MPRSRKSQRAKRKLIEQLHRLPPYRESTLNCFPTQHISDPTGAGRVWYGRGFTVR
jgi:hypothetical protein